LIFDCRLPIGSHSNVEAPNQIDHQKSAINNQQSTIKNVLGMNAKWKAG